MSSEAALRFGHTEGHSGLRYIPDGSGIVSSGADGDIRYDVTGSKLMLYVSILPWKYT